jgi:hypothetical protein
MSMRNFIVLMAATALSACGGSSPNSAGTVSVGGGGAAVGSTSSVSTAATYAEFKSPTVPRTYGGIGGSIVYNYLTDTRGCCNQQAQTFAGRSSTVRNSPTQITYDPRDAVFTLVVQDPLTGAQTSTRFQDPASRTNFGGTVEPQWGVPRLANPNIRYLQAGDGVPLSPYSYSGSGAIYPGTNIIPPDGNPGSTYQSTNFFYELPGTRTNYVSFAGYIRNSLKWEDEAIDTDGNPATPPFKAHKATWHLERGAFAYGITTDPNAVPKTGTGTYTGGFLATMVYNPTIDGAYGPVLPTYFQWIEGSATTGVNFATNAVTLNLTGTVSAPSVEYFTYIDAQGVTQTSYTNPVRTSVAAGSTFTAAGTATINMVTTGGFTGQFQSASFSSTTNGSPTNLNIAGSAIDGTFFGPAAEEVGGGIQIVGGTPDERVDIVGAFTGKKP